MKRQRLAGLRSVVRYFWDFKTTREGKMLAAGIVIAAMPATASLDILAYHFFCGLCGLAFVAYAAGLLLRPRLDAALRFPENAVAGQPITGKVTVTNRARRMAYDLAVGLFGQTPSLQEVTVERPMYTIAPQDSATLPITLLPLKRGVYHMNDLRAFSTFPFNLCRTAARTSQGIRGIRAAPLVAYPRFHRLHHMDVPVGRRHQPGGIALSSDVGDSTEYIGNREYRPGDSLRHIDHRSWGRLGKPVVKEFREEYYCRVALVLDTFVPGTNKPGPEGFPEIEAAVSLCAAVADFLAKGEYIIDIFAAGPELFVFRAGRNTAHFENVLEILAAIDACRTNPFRKVTPALVDELGSISTVICLLLDWDPSREGLVRAAVESACSTQVVIVRDGAPSHPFAHALTDRPVKIWSPRDVLRGAVDSL